MAAFEDLEKAACCLLQIIRDTPDLGRSTKVAIAGDMAMRKYLPKYRPDSGAPSTIDLIINSSTSASLLRKKLLQHPMSPLVESNQLLYYQTTSPSSKSSSSLPTSPGARTPGIEVRITPEMLCPFLPSAATLVNDTTPSPANLPYVSLVDLIVFKMDACGLRDSPQCKQQEALDAVALLERATEHSALDLNGDQRRVVEESLADVLRNSPSDKQSKAWWQARLTGKCDPDARKEATEVLSDMIERMSMEDKERKSSGGSSSTNSSVGSAAGSALLGRSSSSSSKTSLNSMASSASGGNFVTSSSPTIPTHPHAAAQELSCSIPRRSRKFSTSQHMSPVKGSRKSVDLGRPKRHSQVLGSLPSGHIAHNSSSEDASPSSPGLTLTARFESTPAEEKLVTDSYF